MTVRATVIVWLLLLALLGVEILLARSVAGRSLVPLVGVGMAVVVALTFMRLRGSRGLVPIVALAGAFWLCVMLGLGTLDPATRHDLFTIVGHAPTR